MAKNNFKLQPNPYNQIVNNSDALLVNLHNRNFYATKSEMNASVDHPFSDNELGVIKVIANKRTNINYAMFLLDTIIFHRSHNLIHPKYQPNVWKTKGSLTYVRTIDGLFAVYLDTYNKQLLFSADQNVVSIFKDHDYIAERNKNEWKPFSFFDTRHQLIKQIEFLEMCINLGTLSEYSKKLLRKYINRLNNYLILENTKLQSLDKTSTVTIKKPKHSYETPLSAKGLFKPAEWMNSVTLDDAILEEMHRHGVLGKYVNQDLLKENSLGILSRPVIANQSTPIVVDQSIIENGKVKSGILNPSELTAQANENSINYPVGIKNQSVSSSSKSPKKKLKMFKDAKKVKPSLTEQDKFVYTKSLSLADNIDAKSKSVKVLLEIRK